MSSNNIYNIRSSGVQHGDVFTKPEVVKFMLDEVGYVDNVDLSNTSILEPSCGEGEFVVEIVKRLKQSSINFGFDINEAYHRCVFAYDIDERKVDVCVSRIASEVPEIDNPRQNICVKDYLMTSHTEVDIIVGNPPYIRYEEIPQEKIQKYKAFATFYYRVDMYVLFFEKSLLQLKPNGRHCFICANRWMKNKYGRKLRTLVAREYNIKKILNMEEANAFNEEVLAYPAITLIMRDSKHDNVLYADVKDIANIQTVKYKSMEAPQDDDWSNVFNSLEQNLSKIEEQGFKIGIGVATGADNIFISTQFVGNIEEELLVPVINARDLRGDNMKWGGKYLLNPYDNKGQLIPLDKYPKAKDYFEQHREKLASRHKARKVPSRWYATIDPVKSGLKCEEKILLPDISGNSFVFIDEGHLYPTHNIYYITGNGSRQLKILAALLMSDFVRQQLSRLTNHMNGGYARWQSQYLRKLRIPTISNIPNYLADAILNAYLNMNIKDINNCTNEILAYENNSRKTNKPRQMRQQQLVFNFSS